MDVASQKIWKTVKGLRQADNQTTAMCYSIINLMIKQGIVTRQEATRQIEKSVSKVVALHKQIAETMNDKRSYAEGDNGLKPLH